LDATSRDIQSIRLPRWGRVAVGAGAVPWLVFNEEGRAVEPIRRFLIDFVARDNRPGSVRSYAFDLLRWWRWLRVVQVEWDRATSAEVRDFVLWLRVGKEPLATARGSGTRSPVYPESGIAPSTRWRTPRRGFVEQPLTKSGASSWTRATDPSRWPTTSNSTGRRAEWVFRRPRTTRNGERAFTSFRIWAKFRSGTSRRRICVRT
jgi:hypothetical protein